METTCLIVSGFLGSGKTTYINSLLREANGLRLGILVNDFGDIPIDYDLIESVDQNIVELTGGCVCCTYGGDLLSALAQMISRDEKFDALIIETSGLSLPGIIASSVRFVPGIHGVGVLVLVDGPRLPKLIQDKYLSDTVIRQIQDADLVLITKLNHADDVQRHSVEEAFNRHGLSPNTAYSLAVRDVLSKIMSTKNQSEPSVKPSGSSIFSTSLGVKKEPVAGIISLTFSITRSLDPEALIRGLEDSELPIIRAKGILMTEQGYAVVQYSGVGSWDIQRRRAPPTKCGITFFFTGTNEEKLRYQSRISALLAT